MLPRRSNKAHQRRPASPSPLCFALASSPTMSDRIENLRRLRVLYLSSFYILCAVHSTRSLFFEPRRLDLLLYLAIGAFATFFTVVDAKLNQKIIPPNTKWLICFTWPLSAPMCIIWSRGKKGLLKLVFLTIGFFISMYVPRYIVFYIYA